MRKTLLFLLILSFLGGIAYSCKAQKKSSVDKRIHKKRKKAGSMDCPMKDC